MQYLRIGFYGRIAIKFDPPNRANCSQNNSSIKNNTPTRCFEK